MWRGARTWRGWVRAVASRGVTYDDGMKSRQLLLRLLPRRSHARHRRAAAHAAWHRALAVAALGACALLAGCGGGGGSSDSAQAPQTWFDTALYSSAYGSRLDSAQELAVSSKHTVVVDGASHAYTATVGHLTASDPATGAPEASFFYVAYTLDGASAATRPVTFFYNGGPGSATAWLHLGSFSPVRLQTGAPSTANPAPFPLVPNAQSLIDVTDMVFVDAVGAGLSTAIAPNINLEFWGVDADAGVFRDFVRRYLAAYQRDASPKYLFGESYGTTRSAVLARALETAGIELEGVILQSSVLDYNASCGAATVPCTGFVPSYAATGAWYQRDLPNPGEAELPAWLEGARSIATGQFDPAVRAWRTSRTPLPSALAQTLANLTGLDAATWSTRVNVTPAIYQAQLIPGTVLGLYDARMNAPAGSALASSGDPSSAFFEDGFATAITRYLADLGYTTPSRYVLLGNAITRWTFAHEGRALPDTVPDLAAALALNPSLRILSLNGYHDIVTPFYQTEIDLARLGPGVDVRILHYMGGHMTYLDDDSLAREKADLRVFYAAGTAATGLAGGTP